MKQYAPLLSWQKHVQKFLQSIFITYNMQKWQNGVFFFFSEIPAGWGGEEIIHFQKETAGANFCKAPLCITHPPPPPPHVTMDKSDTLGNTHPNLFPWAYEKHRFGNSVPNKPRHFNKPWPTGVTESFSHVKCHHSWPRAKESASSLGHHPVSKQSQPNEIKIQSAFPSFPQHPRERQVKCRAGSLGIPGQTGMPNHSRNTSQGRKRAGKGLRGKPNQSSNLANDIWKCKVILSSRTRNIFRCWNGFCQMPTWWICFSFVSLKKNNHLCIYEKKYYLPMVYKQIPGIWHSLSLWAAFSFFISANINWLWGIKAPEK